MAKAMARKTLPLIVLLVKALVVGLATDTRICPLSEEDCTALFSLKLDGHLSFSDTSIGARDFGNLRHDQPAAILYPGSVEDIAAVVRIAYASTSKLTIAAKGPGHSINGQAQALNGIVIEMSALKGIDVFMGGFREAAYVDARCGELWVDVLQTTLKMGLTPRSFTDYLHLSVGGTLSNAGISGQTFRYGPQISNVLQLEVVTGTGDIVICSSHQHADLFFAVLGGLGQFGIITTARIILEPAPQKVRWIRALYADFSTFTADQEFLISQPKHKSFDYIEGSVVVNSRESSNGWKSIPFHGQNINSSDFPHTAGPVLYSLELTVNFYEHELNNLDQKLDSLLAPLRYLPNLIFSLDIAYFDFLNRVHTGELRLRSNGLWDVPHPWMNLFIPKSRIEEFDAWVIKNVLKDGINGPLLLYPMDKMKWDSRMTAVTPDEDIFYLVGLLRYAHPTMKNVDGLLTENQDIVSFCQKKGIEFKKYLPHYTTEAEWRNHFGDGWYELVRRKAVFDPMGILSPGQRIFGRNQRGFNCGRFCVQ